MTTGNRIFNGLALLTAKRAKPDTGGLLETIAEHADTDPALPGKVLRMAAERVRTRMLTEGEARVIATWLDKLSDGENLFPKARTATDVDKHIDIVWLVKRRIEAGLQPKQAYIETAEQYGLKPAFVANLCSKYKDTVL